MHRFNTLLFVFLAFVPGCDTAREKIERFEQGTRPDEPRPVVPPAPLAPGETPPPPRVIILAVPGLGSELVARGIEQEFLPNLRRLRADGLLWQDVPAAGSAVSACASLFTGTNPGEHGIAAVPPDQLGYTTESVTLGAAWPDAPPELANALVRGVKSRLTRPTCFDALAESGVRSLILRAPIGFPPRPTQNVAALGAGAVPLGFESSAATLFVEGSAEAEHVAPHGTRIVPVRVATSGADDDVFTLELHGPHRLDDTSKVSTMQIELRLPWDRSHGTFRTSDTGRSGTFLRAGQWTAPVRLRFPLSDDVEVFARTRFYLKPLGTKSMQLFVAAPEIEPVSGLPWFSVSQPKELAGRLDEKLSGLPMFTSALLDGPIADGVLDVRAAAALLEQQAQAERTLLLNALVEPNTECIFHWLDLVEQVARLGPGASDPQQKLVVEFFGQRVRRWRLVDAAAAEIDQVVGHAMSAAVSGDLGPDTTVIVWAPYGGIGGERKAGIFGMTRVVDGEVTPPLPEDVTATVFRLLGKTMPTSMTGKALDVGVRMARFPLSEVSARLEAEPEPDADESK